MNSITRLVAGVNGLAAIGEFFTKNDPASATYYILFAIFALMWAKQWGIIYLTPETGYGSYLLMQMAIPPNPIGGCYAG